MSNDKAVRGISQVLPQSAIFRFDKIEFRTARKLTLKQENSLRMRSSSFDWVTHNTFRIVNPRREALEELAKKSYLTPIKVELALDIPTTDRREAEQIVKRFDREFVHRRHGKRRTRQIDQGTYTGLDQDGRIFAWYADKPIKGTERPCFHIECRARGVASVRALGIETAADLPCFDHLSFWEKNLTLCRVDYTKLGKLHRERFMRNASPENDKALGRYVAYKYSRRRTSENTWKDRKGKIHHLPSWRDTRILQHLVDRYGNGEFLVKLNFSSVSGFFKNSNRLCRSLVNNILTDLYLEAKCTISTTS